MSNIRIQLLNVINRESRDSTNFIIAQYMLEHLEQMKVISTKELARECNVSKSSISRFCRKIGYEDFMELQIAIVTYDSCIDERIPDLKGNAVEEFVKTYLADSKRIVDHLEKNLDTAALEELAADLHSFSRVVLMGHVQSSLPAFSLQHYLTILHKFTYSTQDPTEQREMLEQFGEEDLIIIFSAGGRFLERVLDPMSVMERRNIPRIYMITANRVPHLPFVYKYIELWDTYNYASPAVLEMYSDLISLTYRKKYAESRHSG